MNRRLAQSRTKPKKMIPTVKPTIKPTKAINTRVISDTTRRQPLSGIVQGAGGQRSQSRVIV